MCLGPVELAAAGVSIALFNQASRITIFPLVSITTSFVAEENTIEKINTEKKLSDKAKSKEQVMLDDHSLQDIEKVASKENNETENVEMNGTVYPFLVFPFLLLCINVHVDVN